MYLGDVTKLFPQENNPFFCSCCLGRAVTIYGYDKPPMWRLLCGGTHRVLPLAFASLTAGTSDCHCMWEVLVLKHANMCAMLTCGFEFVTLKDTGIHEFVGFCLKAPNSLINTFSFIWFYVLNIMTRALALWSPTAFLNCHSITL